MTVKPCFLDPRTKIFLIITVSGLLVQCGLSPMGLALNGALLCIPLLFYVAAGKYRKALCHGCLYAVCLGLLAFLLPELSGGAAISLSSVCALFLKLTPGITFGFFLICTIEASDLIAALDRMHLPKGFNWTISMVLRFFPTVKEELAATWDGVRLRGHTMGYCVLHPISALVDVFVPLTVSVVNIADELLMATLTKGFDIHGKRTSISVPKLKLQDWCLLALCCAGWGIRILRK